MKRRFYFVLSSVALIWVIYQTARLYMAYRLFPGVVTWDSLVTTETGRFLIIGLAVYLLFFILWLRTKQTT